MSKLPKHLFMGDDGNLYDTREPDWHSKPPVRRCYQKAHRKIDKVAQLKATLRHGPYAWPGGYPLYFLTQDGGALSFKTVQEELHNVVWDIRHGCSTGWHVDACLVNYEERDLRDDHTGEFIECAYEHDDNECP